MNIQIIKNGPGMPRIIDADSGLEIKDILSYQIDKKVDNDDYSTITLTIRCDKIIIKHNTSDIIDNIFLGDQKIQSNKTNDQPDKITSDFSNLILE